MQAIVTKYCSLFTIKDWLAIDIMFEVGLSLNNNEVNIYSRIGKEWKLEETLQGHDLRVTGIDWAPNTNRIVTCGA
ncbi:unnamed protein product, partial [Rotaria socialis]